MLVPSYTWGKTRSIRIPYVMFYILVAAFLTIVTTFAVLQLRAAYFQRVASDYSMSLDEINDAFTEYQAYSLDEQIRLLEDKDEIQSRLNETLRKSRQDQHELYNTYQEELDELWDLYDELLQIIIEFDEDRRVLLEQYSSSPIPPVKTLTTDLVNSQNKLLSDSGAYKGPLPSVYYNVTFDSLVGYGDFIAARLDAQSECYADLQTRAKKIDQYVKNYPTTLPVPSKITSGFGYRRNPMGGGGTEHHNGVDLTASTGSNVKATGGGTVIKSGWQNGYGYTVVVDHGFGIHTLYAHNSKLLVSVGQKVARGDIIAKSGNTGRSTGPHVHYEVHVNGKAVNPRSYIFY